MFYVRACDACTCHKRGSGFESSRYTFECSRNTFECSRYTHGYDAGQDYKLGNISDCTPNNIDYCTANNIDYCTANNIDYCTPNNIDYCTPDSIHDRTPGNTHDCTTHAFIDSAHPCATHVPPTCHPPTRPNSSK